MARKRKELASTKRPVPLWVVSYGDMTTNLLTFFILLLSLAETQDAGLLAAGTGSFIHALDTLGLPGILPSNARPLNKESFAPNFPIPSRHVERVPKELANDQLIHQPPRDRLQRATVDYLRQNHAVAFPTAVAFQPGTAELVPSSAGLLDTLAELAQQNLSYVGVEACVSGPGDGWRLSALRAAAVARYLRDRCGIGYERIAMAGYGRFRPVAAQAADSASETNDRISILLSPKPLD